MDGIWIRISDISNIKSFPINLHFILFFRFSNIVGSDPCSDQILADLDPHQRLGGILIQNQNHIKILVESRVGSGSLGYKTTWICYATFKVSDSDILGRILIRFLQSWVLFLIKFFKIWI